MALIKNIFQKHNLQYIAISNVTNKFTAIITFLRSNYLKNLFLNSSFAIIL